MIAVFTADFKDEEDGKDHPNRIPTPSDTDLPVENEEEEDKEKKKKRRSRRKHKKSKGTLRFTYVNILVYVFF